jgi:hypothetical protein
MSSWREAALALIFEDAQAGQAPLEDGSVPLVKLIEELSAGFRPTQEIFEEVARLLCGFQLELCDDGTGVSIRQVRGKAKPHRAPLRRLHLPMGDLARLAAAFDQVCAGTAAPGTPPIIRSGPAGLAKR